jgi:tetratricopeptide (TPR) repeat protein
LTKAIEVDLIKIMYRTTQTLRILALIVPVLALCSISTAIHAANALWVGTTLDGKKCTGSEVPFGPYDYLQRAQFPGELGVVEDNHFTAEVEQLIDREWAFAIADIHYTIGAWPNHHRALQSALTYRLRNLNNYPTGMGVSTAECYLQRAIKFSPNDPRPYIMYGVLLQKVKQYDGALKAYRVANRLLPDDVITQYNMGLTLAALKQYKEAAQLAQKVYATGFPLPGLKNKLTAAGYWKDGAPKDGPASAKSMAAKPELTPAQVLALEKAMQTMTPEQKEAFKKAMQDQAAPKAAAPVTATP